MKAHHRSRVDAERRECVLRFLQGVRRQFPEGGWIRAHRLSVELHGLQNGVWYLGLLAREGVIETRVVQGEHQWRAKLEPADTTIKAGPEPAEGDP